MVTSDPHGVFPPVSATIAVSDAQPLMRLDPDPRMPDSSRYSAMSIIATLSAEQANLVGPGSSGGPVLNSKGELVGLVWTGRELADGSTEILITPASAWLRRLQSADMPEDALQVVFDARCEERTSADRYLLAVLEPLAPRSGCAGSRLRGHEGEARRKRAHRKLRRTITSSPHL
jgi:hypothetical protein